MNWEDEPSLDRDRQAQMVSDIQAHLKEGKGIFLAGFTITADEVQTISEEEVAILTVSEGFSKPQIVALGDILAFAKSGPKEDTIKELRCLQICENTGIRSLKPLLITHDDKTSYLLTKLEPIIPVSKTIIASKEIYEKIAHEAAAAVTRLHEQGIIHKDPAPKNFGYDPSGQFYIYDFNVSEISENRLTPAVRNKEIDHLLANLRAYTELISGKLPYDSDYWYQNSHDVAAIESHIRQEFFT